MKATFSELYRRLFEFYGPQHWWPAEDAFEMMLGAILIQHTAWANASRAIEKLSDAGLLDPEPLHRTTLDRLENLIRSAGVYKVKAQRIQAFLGWYRSNGELRSLGTLSTIELRRALLSVNGIGPETADNILVYAFRRPVFVVDAYSRRLFRRYNLANGGEKYSQLQAAVESALPGDAATLGEFHALIVEHGKQACRRRPLCEECCLRATCARVLN